MKPEFNAVKTKLERGFTVIEASAGTGKTTTISAMVLRQLLEERRGIEEILIATYTELATAELRGRIRETIKDALQVLRGGSATMPFVAEIVSKISDRDEAERRLETSRQNFDLAPIFTIHGFCARVLAECAFESGALFELELTTDQSRLLAEIADDFWRAHFSSADSLIARALKGRLTPKTLLNLLAELATNPRLRVIPPAGSSAPLEKKLRTTSEGPDFESVAAEFALAVQSDFCAWARRELPRRKAARQLQTFDDLLTRLDDALRGDSGATLRATLRQRYPVALIDEFQDTDPVQYSILWQIYDGGDASVFFIGDPKQAIYAFRGADVFAYLAAQKAANRIYTLGKNFRSEERLVAGVSELFEQRRDAFVIDGIDFPKVRGEDRGEILTRDRARDQPLHFWISAGDERKHFADRVAQEIARLLTCDAKIGDRKIAPRDIAILVNANLQPPELQRALARFRLATVVYSTANVFKSREADELVLILRAVTDPRSARKVRAALATELLGLSSGALADLATDETAWEKQLDRFAESHLVWRDRGFVEMMRGLLVRDEVRARLLALTDGERRLTNVLHLIELLHVACAQNRFGLEGLTTWLARQTQNSEAREEFELRLESDDDAIRLVTVHKSKGLEYGITFYPFARRDLRQTKGLLKFHEEGELVLDLQKSPGAKEKRDGEELAESVRQLYVALTRAKHRSYVIWRDSSQKSKAALAWLLDRKSVADVFASKGVEKTAAELRVAFAGNKNILVEAMPAHEKVAAPPLRADRRQFSPRVFAGEIDRSWGLFSFSALTRDRSEEPETPDYDSTETPLETEPLLPAQGIHAFPGGTRAGTCLHKILEQLDFQNPADYAKIVKEQLEKFHLQGHEELITRTIEQLIGMPVADFSLREISARLAELEFTFPINALTATRLQQIFGHDLPAKIGALQFQLANGFMKGFIDLVFEREGKFYFADWKSNWLGLDASFYSAANLADAMSENFYLLQLSIYAVALHRFLHQRLRDYSYEKNFGGAFYVFLRGLDNKSRGVFEWRPPRAFIEKLDSIFYGND